MLLRQFALGQGQDNMRRTIAGLCLALPVALWLGSPVLADDREEANRQMVRAVTAWNEAEALNGGNGLVLRLKTGLLGDVVESLETIVEEHSGSDLAVRLIIGEQIGPLSLDRARKAYQSAREGLDLCQSSAEPECVFAMALDAADELRPGVRDMILPALATSLAEAGHGEAADTLMAQVDPEDLEVWDVIQFAKAQKDAAAILEVIEKAKLDEESTWSFEAVQGSIALAEIGEYDKALAVAGSLQAEDSRDDATLQVCHAMAARGDTEKAFEALAQIPSATGRAEAREGIAHAQRDAGLHDEAFRTTMGIEDEARRDVALLKVIDPRKDGEAFNAALARIAGVLASDRADRDDLRSSLLHAQIFAYTRAGDFDRAIELARSGPGGLQQLFSFQHVAASQAEAGAVEDALNTVALIHDKHMVESALTRVAEALAREHSRAEAVEVAERIESERGKVRAFCSMGVAFAEGGMVNDALEHLSAIDAEEPCRAESLAKVAAILSTTSS